jgi:hypothetical protein
MALTEKGSICKGLLFFLTMRFGKRKLVVWNDIALLELLGRTGHPGCMPFFPRFKKNRPMQGHVAPGDYDGRFQGSTFMQVDDPAFGYGCWPLLKWLSIEQ